jgi:hypothetical protein
MTPEEQAALFENLRRADEAEAQEERLIRANENARLLRAKVPDVPQEPPPVPRPQRPPQRDWASEDRRTRSIASRQLEPLAAEIGAALGKQERRVRDLDDRLTASETAVTELLLAQERQIAELERRIGDLEKAKPRKASLTVVNGGEDSNAA